MPQTTGRHCRCRAVFFERRTVEETDCCPKNRWLVSPQSECTGSRAGTRGLACKSCKVLVRISPDVCISCSKGTRRQSLSNPDWFASRQDCHDRWSFGDRSNRREPRQSRCITPSRLSRQQVLPVRIGPSCDGLIPCNGFVRRRARGIACAFYSRLSEGDGMSPGMRATTVRLAGSDEFVADEPSPRGVCLS